MFNVETRIWLSSDVYYNEWHYLYGEKANDRVRFTYHNVKTDKESTKTGFTYRDALALARMRRADGRYKNYEFYIG